MKKLERRGYATRVGKRSYIVSLDVPKKAVKAARAR